MPPLVLVKRTWRWSSGVVGAEPDQRRRASIERGVADIGAVDVFGEEVGVPGNTTSAVRSDAISTGGRRGLSLRAGASGASR